MIYDVADVFVVSIRYIRREAAKVNKKYNRKIFDMYK